MYEGKKQSLFDILEDTDYDECLARSQAVANVPRGTPRPAGKMQAFVFIKPHAVTEKTKQLVSEKFGAVGLRVYQEGSLDAKVIEENKLIDNHYYAIANKASLSKPAELNPPAAKQAEFEKKFGVSWSAALAAGSVYNAVDGCSRLGIDGAQIDAEWARAKKDGNLLKFGGGFYAGKIPRKAQAVAAPVAPPPSQPAIDTALTAASLTAAAATATATASHCHCHCHCHRARRVSLPPHPPAQESDSAWFTAVALSVAAMFGR